MRLMDSLPRLLRERKMLEDKPLLCCVGFFQLVFFAQVACSESSGCALNGERREKILKPLRVNNLLAPPPFLRARSHNGVFALRCRFNGERRKKIRRCIRSHLISK